MKFDPIQTNTLPFNEKLINLAWFFVNRTLFRFSPPTLSLFRLWRVFLVKLFGGHISWNCSLHPTARIEYPWRVFMGEFSSIGENSWIYALDTVKIGTKCCIGKDVYLLTGSHDISSSGFDLVCKPIQINDNVWIAPRSIILPGITVGEYCVVAVGSVVVKDVAPRDVVGGNPARFIKIRELRC
jgi:putative colanic acid biosynthesis acetyltransferase WcaF